METIEFLLLFGGVSAQWYYAWFFLQQVSQWGKKIMRPFLSSVLIRKVVHELPELFTHFFHFCNFVWRANSPKAPHQNCNPFFLTRIKPSLLSSLFNPDGTLTLYGASFQKTYSSNVWPSPWCRQTSQPPRGSYDRHQSYHSFA